MLVTMCGRWSSGRGKRLVRPEGGVAAGLIDDAQLCALARQHTSSGYGDYLLSLVDGVH